MIRLGILGCGMIGKSFIEQAIKHKSFCIAAICSKTKKSLDKALKIESHAKTYLNKEEFFRDPNVDAIIVCTPHKHHANDACQAIENNKHVMIEKPIATNKADLSALISMADLKKNVIVTALPHGEYKYIKKAKEIINSGLIGKITAFHSFLDVPGPPRSNWYYSEEAVGGASLDTLPYALGRLISLVGQKASLVIGFKNQLISHRKCEDGVDVNPQVDDNATLIIEYKNGQQAIVRSSWNTDSPQDYLTIHGRKGVINIDTWLNSITVQTSFEPIKSLSLKKERENFYKIDIKRENPEKLKLEVFLDNILRKKGNLDSLAYQTDIILSLLNENGILSVDRSMKDSSSISQELNLGKIYI